MIIATDMPEVAQCAVSKCAYNVDTACHARAITIGDGSHPGCDTFFKNSSHVKSRRVAGVGACKVSGCAHNTDFECTAESIQVDMNGGAASCQTYTSH